MGDNEGPQGAEAERAAAALLHAPVLLSEVLKALGPLEGGAFLDGTFGAGGYARAILEAGAARVIGLDRDPSAIARAEAWAPLYGGRLTLSESAFSRLDQAAGGAATLDGVALDLGVSSMQLDEAARGFSFLRDGPLDMRMGADAARSAAEIVNEAGEAEIADILYHYGEERASRRIARKIVAERAAAPIATTHRLAEIVASCLPRPKPGHAHSATRSFQALRIAVNAEFDELVAALGAAERALKLGGRLAVVTFHSIEDRIVKRFLAARSGRSGGVSRHAPVELTKGEDFGSMAKATFTLERAKPIGPSEREVAANPRARSAKLRWARRTAAPAQGAAEAGALGAPSLAPKLGPARRTGRARG